MVRHYNRKTTLNSGSYIVSVANLLQWSYHGGTPCSVLVGEETSESAAKASVSDVGNRSSSSGRQRPSQTPSQSSGGIYIQAFAQSRKRRSLDAQHVLPSLSVVQPPVHDPATVDQVEHDSIDSSDILPPLVMEKTNIDNESGPGVVENTPLDSSYPVTIPGYNISNPTNLPTTSEILSSTNSPRITTITTTTVETVGGPRHRYYRQNIIRRMQNMILAGHMSESFVPNNLDPEKNTTDQNLSNSETTTSKKNQTLLFPFQLHGEKNVSTTELPQVKFEHNMFDFQSDFPMPPLAEGRKIPQQLTKTETILHPLTLQNMKNKESHKNSKNLIVGSVVKAEKFPEKKTFEEDADNVYRFGDDEIEIFQLENFEEVVKKAVDEVEVEKIKALGITSNPNNIPEKNFSITDSESSTLTNIKNHTNTTNTATTESDVTPNHFATQSFNPSVISLTLPNDPMHGSKSRVFVNLTITTGDESSQTSSSSALSPVFVLSLSLPSGNNTGNINIHPVVQNLENKTTWPEVDSIDTSTDSLIPGFINRGGECQCSCPCLSNSNPGETKPPVQSHLKMFSGSSSTELFLTTTQDPISSADESTIDEFSQSTDDTRVTESSNRVNEYETTLPEFSSTTDDMLKLSTPEASSEVYTLNLTQEETYFAETKLNTTASSEDNNLSNLNSTTSIEDGSLEEETDNFEETELLSSTTVPFECPKVTPPPPTVLILEGKSIN